MALKHSTEIVTPAQAIKWLDGHENYRPLQQRKVDIYSRDMLNGKWHNTGDPIRFDVNGNLCDGQHRLWACVQSEVEFKTSIVRGVPLEAVPHIDQGRPRTAVDFLSHHGVKNSRRVAAAVRFVERIASGDIHMKANLSPSEILSRAMAQPRLMDAVRFCCSRKTSGFISDSVMAGLMANFHPREISEEFFSKLLDGYDLRIGNPILTLRNRLIANAASAAKLGQMDMAALVISAWNAYIRGRALRKIVRPKKFPTILRGE